MKIKKWITNNIGLKILALLLAVVTWFYTNWELAKRKHQDERAIISMLQYEIISKKVPIKLTIVGDVAFGYTIDEKGITVEPETIVVVGPEKILSEVKSVQTIPIDISEYTKDFNRHISLTPIADGIALRDNLVKVYIPIIKNVEAEEPIE